MRGRDVGLPADEHESAAITGSLYAPWQTLSALATETGQAVRQTFSESGVGTSGHVQQSVPQSHFAPQTARTAGSFNEAGGIPNSDIQTDDAPWTAQNVRADDGIESEAVQAEIDRVQRKMLSRDAATEVILRFNFITGPEARVNPSCLLLPAHQKVCH